MSEENVEVVWEMVDALNRSDADAFVACLSPDVEWEERTDAWPGFRGVYRGRAEAREWFEVVVLEVWENFHIEVEEITEATADQLFYGASITARGVGSGVETETRAWGVIGFAENGKIARRQVFWTRKEAIEAAGLEE